MGLPPIIHLPASQPVRGKDAAGASSVRRMMKKRYNIILRIRHPELDPMEITAALGWEPHQSWQVGDQSVTPKGTKLPSTRIDGLWSHTFSYKGEARITEKLDQILEHLIIQKDLFHELAKRGVQSALYLQLPGDTNIGDHIPWNILMKFAELKIALELETFPDWT